MSIRSSALLLTVCSACATAGGSPAGATGSAPPPDSGVSDATVHDASPDPDAPAHPDAALPPDAPASGCTAPYSGVLASWSLAGLPGSQTSTAATSSAPGVTAGSLQRSAALTALAGSGSMNASNWATGAQLDPTRYFTVALTPPAGCTVSVSALALDLKASSTGPASAAVATSADAFAQSVPANPNAATTPALAVTGATGAVEIRIYGYAAAGATGTMRVQNTLQVTGSLQ